MRLLNMAQQLLTRVECQHEARNWGGNDVLMRTYNDLIQAGAELFAGDEVLNGQMTKLPDKILRAFGAGCRPCSRERFRTTTTHRAWRCLTP